MTVQLIRAFTLSLFAFVIISCGEEEEKERFTASAVLQFSESSGLNVASASAPTIFGMKLIAAYVAEDIDPISGGNTGTSHMIYLNPDCNENIRDCDISAGTNADGAPYGNIVSTYFDFSNPSTVNASLNSQKREVVLWEDTTDDGSQEPPEDVSQTFRYARLEFCKTNTGNSQNVKWGNASTGEVAFQRNSCTVNSAKFASDLVIDKSQVITISLAYSISSAVLTGEDATGDNCTGSGSSKACFTLPTFNPTASK